MGFWYNSNGNSATYAGLIDIRELRASQTRRIRRTEMLEPGGPSFSMCRMFYAAHGLHPSVGKPIAWLGSVQLA